MNCHQIRELLPELAAGMAAPTPEVSEHVATCNDCAAHLLQLRKTMAVLEEWQAPEQSCWQQTPSKQKLPSGSTKMPQAGAGGRPPDRRQLLSGPC